MDEMVVRAVQRALARVVAPGVADEDAMGLRVELAEAMRQAAAAQAQASGHEALAQRLMVLPLSPSVPGEGRL